MDEDRMTSTFGSNWMCAAVLSILLACAPWLAHAQTRFELWPLETVTLSTQQLLLSEKYGTPVMLAEELRIPKPGTDRLPAVILMHSAGAINPATDQWAQKFNNIGILCRHVGDRPQLVSISAVNYAGANPTNSSSM